MRSWQLQQAKNRLSELVDRAIADGPQTITRHGKPAAVVVAHKAWKKKQARKPGVYEALTSFPRTGLSNRQIDRMFARIRVRPRKIVFG